MALEPLSDEDMDIFKGYPGPLINDNNQARNFELEGFKVSTSPVNIPQAILRENGSGVLDVEIEVSTEGEIINIEVIESRPSGVFDKYVLDSLKKWKFQELGSDNNNKANKFRQRFEFIAEYLR